MRLSQALLLVVPAACLLVALLASLARGSASLAENLLQRGLIVLGLALVALHLLAGAGGTPAGPPLLLLLVDRHLLETDPGRVRRERARVPEGVEVRTATFVDRHPAAPPARAGEGSHGLRPVAAFSSPAAALGWAEAEALGRERSAVVGLTRRPLPAGRAGERRAVSIVLPPEAPPLRIAAVSVPPVAFLGRALRVRAEVALGKGERALLRLFDGASFREGRSVEGEGGTTTVDFPLAGLAAGTHVLRIDAVDGSGEAVDRRHARVVVRPAPAVDYLTLQGAPTPLSRSLRAQGFPVTDLGPDVLAPGGGEVVFLEDLPPSRLPWAAVSALYERASRSGTPVVVVGGERSFGPGGYAGAPIERLLPVWMGLKDRDREKHATAFLVIVDTSASMLCPPEGCPSDKERMWGPAREARGPRVSKLELARQALLNLLPAMKDVDSLGILGGRMAPYWEVEASPMKDLDEEDVRRRVRAMDAAGGGIHLYSAFLEARKAMAGAAAEIKHVVVLLDTDDVDEINIIGLGSVETLAAEMARENVSLSFVGIGFSDDRYVPLLNRLASSTGGYLYVTSDVGEVPSFLSRDRERLSRDQVVRKPLATRFSRRDLPGIDGTPPLEGQFVTEAKKSARVLVWSELGYPVFTVRRLGRGSVAALSADGGQRLAPAWAASEAHPAWDALLGALSAGRRETGGLFISRRGGDTSVFFSPGREAASRGYEARLEGGGAEAPPSPMTEVFPGVYRSDLGELPAGSYRLGVAAPGERGEAAATDLEVRSAPRERDPGETDYRSLLGEATAPPAPRPGEPWLRLLLILAAGAALCYEIVRQR